MKAYNVLVWNFNKDAPEFYDIMPYLCQEFKEDSIRKPLKVFMSKDRIPKTREEYQEFILKASRYQFQYRCQYEILISGWPKQKNEIKLDVFDQIKANIEVITNLFIENVNSDN